MRPVPRDLAELRLKAEAAARADDWSTLASYAGALREHDVAWWPHMWAPLLAIAMHEMGKDPAPMLEEAVAGGFRQPEMYDLDRLLGDLPDWSEWSRRMREPAPAPTIEVVRWPTVTYGPELVLDRLPTEREQELRERLPRSASGAWDTARMLLEWATTRWEHANDHVDSRDAVEVLDRAAAGERFACLEYSVVLSQALNAAEIPARRVSVRTRDEHVGGNRGHVVSEAWIGDLGRWVVLDGQSGAWWGTPEEPLGLRELQRLERAGEERPEMCLTAREVGWDEQTHWFSYFHTAASSGLEWTATFVPLFQGEPSVVRLVVPDDALTHPDLSEIATGSVDAGEPALTFSPVHPFASGVEVRSSGEQVPVGTGDDEPFRLEFLPPGRHDLTVHTLTRYGALAGQPLEIVRR
jgi:hypothetical protein